MPLRYNRQFVYTPYTEVWSTDNTAYGHTTNFHHGGSFVLVVGWIPANSIANKYPTIVENICSPITKRSV